MSYSCMRQMNPSVQWIVALVLTMVIGGCSDCGKKEPSEKAGEKAGEPSVVGGTTAAQPAKLTVTDLQPILREWGEPGAVPESIVIDFARPLLLTSEKPSPTDEESEEEPNRGFSKRESKKSAFSINPSIPGKLMFTGPSTLTFVPGEAFSPGTTYTATLSAVETWSGVIQAPSPNPWVRQFATPVFGFTRLALRNVDPARAAIELDLIFSAPVDAKVVGEYASFKLNGILAPKVYFDRATEKNRVRVRLIGIKPTTKTRIEFLLKAGAPMAGSRGVRAAAAQTSLSLEGEIWEIQRSYRSEGPTGHFIEVVCSDHAIKGDKRYYWDRAEGRSYNISRRCLPNDTDAAEGIHFTPPVKFSIASSGGGFRILGDFKRGTYTLRIDGGVRTVDGGMLPGEYQASFSFPARAPQVSFVSKGRYLPKDAAKNLAIKHLNVDQVEIEVRQVPQENLVFWMGDDNEKATERTSNLVMKKKLPLRGVPDISSTSFMDLGSMLPGDQRGLLELTLQSGASRDTARLLLTNLHLVAKRMAKVPTEDYSRDYQVWVLDVDSIDSVSGAEVKLVRKSGQVLARCTTSGADGCRLQVSQPDLDPSQPFALLASKGDDFTYLKFNELQDGVSETAISGEPYRSDQPYRAAIYSDRGVYRPGETAHVVGLVRDQHHLAPKEQMPVMAEVQDPRGKTILQRALTTNLAGVVSLDLPFAAFAATGKYQISMKAGERKIGEYGLQVEEFVPERMKVTAKTERPTYLIGETIKVQVQAKYLFGGVPANSRVEISCELWPHEFAPDQNANFHYGVYWPEDKPQKPLLLGTATGALNDKGEEVLECPGEGIPAVAPGPMKLLAKVAVFEAGSGRTTQGEAASPVHPERFYLGLSSGAESLVAGQSFSVDGAVVDWSGSLIKNVGEVELQFFRMEEEYSYSYEDESGEGGYQRYRRPVLESKIKVPVSGGKFSTTLTPAVDASGFLIRVKAQNAQTDLEISGRGGYYYWAPAESQVDQTPRPAKPTWIKLEAPKQIQVGQAAVIKFKAPYRGRVLLTAETDRLLKSEWKAVDAGEVRWNFTAPAFAPNVYITAFLVKDPHLDSKQAFMPDRAFGVVSAVIEPVEYTQTVKLDVPKEIRSSSKFTVNLDLGRLDGPTFATVAAVDEGVLSLTRFESPDPFKILFARRALGVDTFETVGWTLLLPAAGPSSSPGGDEGGGAAGRVQPVKPVALWSGVLPVPDNGKLAVPFEVPQYRGALRVMVVTAGPKRMGKASESILVRDPLVVQLTVPRFLSEGDEIQVPVFLTNMAGARKQVAIQLSVESLPTPGLQEEKEGAPPVEVVGKTQKSLSLDNGQSGITVFRARARRAFGAAKFKVVAKTEGLEVRADSDVPLLPSGPRTRLVQRVALNEGSTDLLNLLKGWVPLSEQSTFWVTTNPYGEAFDHLKYLVRYPYGCIEQTTSTTRPLLFLSDLIGSVDPTLVAAAKIEDMVIRGIDRVFSMQTPSGGFAFWPGSNEPTHWGTAYATHMLLDAQKLGYPVPKDRLEDALKYMETELNTRFENRVAGHDSWDDTYYGGSEAYMHYVLAATGRPRKGRIERLISQIPAKSKGYQIEQAYMLKAALFLAGDRRYERDLKSPDISPFREERNNGWSFYSDRRARGFMLSTFQDLFGNDPAGEPLAEMVAEGLKAHDSGWYTTQELVWSVTGLGKRQKGAVRSFTPVTLTASGKSVAEQPKSQASKSSDQTWSLARASEFPSLSLSVPKKPDGNLWLIASSVGVREKAEYKTGGEGLGLSRSYLDSAGKELGPNEVVLGDVVYAEITITNKSPERISNIVLVDRFPAGWEVENPRLGRGSGAEFIDTDKLWKADYLNIRDDRLEFFGSLERGASVLVVYALRAVTAGRFTLPPVEAEAMYNPRFWAREAGKTIQVAGPWQGYLD